MEGGWCAAQELAEHGQALVHPLPPCGWVDATDAHLVAILAADAHAEDEAARPETLQVGQLASNEDRVAERQEVDAGVNGEFGIERGNHSGVQDPVEAGAGDEADVITAADVVEPCCGHLVEEGAEPLRVGQEPLGRKQTNTHHGGQPSRSGVAGEATRTDGLAEDDVGSSTISASLATVASR